MERERYIYKEKGEIKTKKEERTKHVHPPHTRTHTHTHTQTHTRTHTDV
jgi:hypothetical protein